MGAYQRHKRKGEPLDSACEAAAIKYWADQRERRGTPKRRAHRSPPVTDAPKVRCPFCGDLEVVEYPFDAVAGRMGRLRHYDRKPECGRFVERPDVRNLPACPVYGRRL